MALASADGERAVERKRLAIVPVDVIGDPGVAGRFPLAAALACVEVRKLPVAEAGRGVEQYRVDVADAPPDGLGSGPLSRLRPTDVGSDLELGIGSWGDVPCGEDQV